MRILLVVLFLLSTESILLSTATDGTQDENSKQSKESQGAAAAEETEATPAEQEPGDTKNKNQTVATSDMKKIIDTRAAAIMTKFTKDTWAIAATTPLLPRAAHVLERQQVQRQTPYVHWTCFRQETARPHDILQCCQEIYKIQELTSDLLCWKRDGCRADKKGRSEFISHCSHHSVHLRHDSLSDPSSPSLPHFSPQFTFVSAPEFSDLHWANINEGGSSSNNFRQLIAYSTVEQHEQWFYDVHSPLELALDPFSYLADKTNDDDDTPTSFTAKLTSSILSDEDNDEDKRSLFQKLRIDLPSAAAHNKETKQKKSFWKVSLNIILFLPEGIELIRRDALTACTSSCAASSKKACTIARGERVISTTSSSWMFDQQSVQFLTVTVENDTDNNGETDDCELSWTVHLMVPDDDNILLPSPTIFNGTAVVVHDDDTLDETSTILRFRTSYAYALPMTLALDEWGNEL